jgi:ribosomal protein L37E
MQPDDELQCSVCGHHYELNQDYCTYCGDVDDPRLGWVTG